MGFWHLAFVAGLIIWTACVFLRAVAARTHLLRLQLILPPEDPDGEAPKVEGLDPGSVEPPQLAEVVSKHQPARGGHAKPSGNGKPGSNGSSNGHAKVPVRKPGR